MKYTVVASNALEDLIRDVNELLAKGWEPAPGFSVNTAYKRYFQALIYKDKDQEDT